MNKKKVAVCVGLVALVVTLIFVQKTIEASELMHLAAEDFIRNFPFEQDGSLADPPAIIPTEPHRTHFLIYLCSALISGAISIGSFVYAGALFLKGRRRLKITFKKMFPVSLLLLTFTVIIYDNHVFFNPPKVLYIEVWRHGEYGEILESWETVVNITDHPLKEGIMYYVNESMDREPITGRFKGETVHIFNPELEDFFGKYHVSTWCLTCALEMSPYLIDGDSYYHVLVGYSKVGSSPFEYAGAWSVSIATIILWFVTISSIQKLKSEKELKTNV